MPRESTRDFHHGLLGRLGVVSAIVAGLSLAACASKDRPSPLVDPGGGADVAAAPLAQDSPLEELAEEQEAEDDEGGEGVSGKDVDLERREEGGAELALADYERLLVEQELRLRSAGLMPRGDEVAAAGDVHGGGLGGAGAGRSPAQEPPAASPGLVGKAGAPPAAESKPTKRSKKKKSKKNSSKSGGSGVGGGRTVPSRSANADRCVMICDLAASTCDLERRICELASRHPDEERYAQVCARASDDCELARSACESCPV